MAHNEERNVETKFKIGDKVVCGDREYPSSYGKVGEVVQTPSVASTLYRVTCGGVTLSYFESELTPEPEYPKHEWDGVFRVGDKGVTRGGDSYEVIRTSDKSEWNGIAQPIVARCSDSVIRCFTADGFFFSAPRETLHDLMPPTERGPVVATEVVADPAPTVATITVPTQDGDVVMTGSDVAALMRRVAELEDENARLKCPSSSEAQQARSWSAVWNELWKVFPYSESGSGSGQEKALTAIRKMGAAWDLATKPGKVVELKPGEQAELTGDTFVQLPGGRELRASDADFPAVAVQLNEVVRSWEEDGGVMFADMLLLRDAYRDWAKN